MYNLITETKNSVQGVNSRITNEEEWISKLEDRMVEINNAEQNRVTVRKKNGDRHRDCQENIMCTSIQIIQVSEEEDKKEGCQKIFEKIIVENFPKIGKKLSPESRNPRESYGG